MLLSAGMFLLYLPPSPAALVWPQEWAIAGGWAIAGAVLYLWAKARYSGESARIIKDAELRAGHTDIEAVAQPARSGQAARAVTRPASRSRRRRSASCQARSAKVSAPVPAGAGSVAPFVRSSRSTVSSSAKWCI